MSENATTSFVKSAILQHETEGTKRLKEAIDEERKNRHKQVDKTQEIVTDIYTKYDTMKDKITNNEKELWIHKSEHKQMAESVKEIKADVKAHSTTLEKFLEKIEEKFVTKSEYNVVVRIIWAVWGTLVIWGASFIWDKISKLI